MRHSPTATTLPLEHSPEVQHALELYNACLSTAGRGDFEAAHGYEDELRGYALECVVSGKPGALDIARLALATATIDFARVCA